ncbi:MAG TPA: hypothetical protein VFH73_26705 [Polyangia bacterium]|nr:hypothetical protein [Polyangia bacterium]
MTLSLGAAQAVLASAALAITAGAAFDAGTSAPIVVPGLRTTPLQALLTLGTPVERALPSVPYALAIGKDEEEQWGEAAALYQQAIADWSTSLRLNPSTALERAVQKAERERQRSQQLASMVPARPESATAVHRAISLERGRLYRTKLMVVRAYTGSIPRGLHARARDAFSDALRMTEKAKPAMQAEVYLLLCATHAAADRPEAARVALAHVTRAQREDPANALPMAICAAALDDLPLALTQLEGYVVRQGGDMRMDPFSLRDILLANDWDRLRGDRRFESLFARVARY